MAEPELEDLSLRESVVFACRCGAVVPATRWRWIDVVRRPELAERVRQVGPFEGTCSQCGEPLVGFSPWVAIEPRKQRALLVLWEHHRGELLDAAEDHIRALRRYPQRIVPWLVSPSPKFLAAPQDQAVASEGRVTGSNELRMDAEAGRAEEGGDDPGSGIPQWLGPDPRPGPVRASSIGVVLGELRDAGGKVRVVAQVPAGHARHWERASLQVRPILLRNLGYPLVGVRILGAYLGQVGCLEAIGDVADPSTNTLLRLLSQDFQVELHVTEEGHEEQEGNVATREVAGRNLERNVGLCLESARAMLASGEYPPEAYGAAREALLRLGMGQRLERGQPTLVAGAYAHLVGAAETRSALAHVADASNPEDLARILEEEGLPIREYEAIRRRVLQAARDQGLCAPRRFWRRVVASGLARDLQDYVIVLARNRARAVSEGDDLTEEQRLEAWGSLAELCERKSLEFPDELREAMPLPDLGQRYQRSDSSHGNGRSGGLVGLLHDRNRRLAAATELLEGCIAEETLAQILDLLEDFDNEELLAILPNLSELGARVVPGLVRKLESERREVRQSAAILLGLTSVYEALAPLVRFVLDEPSSVWIDAARALATYGSAALDPLCRALRQARDDASESMVLRRVSRVMAEIAVENAHGDSRLAVERLAVDGSGADSLVSEAARRALESLTDVSESGAQIRGERPLAEVTAVRGFSQRAYEAIMIPELELVEDVELEG